MPKGTDVHMMVIKEFMDELHNKTLFTSENYAGTDLAPSSIKSIFAFADPDQAYPIGELGKNARVKSSTMTDMVDRMERDGLAARVRDPRDRRLVKVQLTEKGKSLRNDFFLRRRQELNRLFARLSEQEVQQFIHHISEALNILKKL